MKPHSWGNSFTQAAARWAEHELVTCRKAVSTLEVGKQKARSLHLRVVEAAGAGNEHYRSLYGEYEARKSLEAQIVKAADVIDLLVQALALERGGARGLDEFWDVAEKDNLLLEEVPREVFNEIISKLKEARRALLG